MPTLTIEGKRVKVDDAFMQLSPEQQAEAVEEIAGSIGVSSQPQQSGLAGTASDFVQSLGTGLREGAEFLAGTAGDVRELGERGLRAVGASEGVITASKFLSPPGFGTAPTTQQIQDVTNPLIGPPRQPQTTAGEFGRTIGQFAPAAATGPGGFVRRGAQAVIPAIASEAAGQATQGTSAEPFARIAGALGGGAAVAGGRGGAIRQALKGSPTTRQLKQQTDAAYSALRSRGIVYDADEFGRMVGSLGKNMNESGFRRATAPKAFALLDEMTQGVGRSPNFDDVNSMKQAFGQLLRSAEGPERGAAGRIMGVIDAFETNAPVASLAGASRQELNTARRGARDLAQRNIKSRLLDDIVEQSKTMVSGQENGLRNRVAALLRSKKGAKTFKGAEREALLELAKGGTARNALTMLGKFGFDPSRMGSTSTLGGFLGGGGTFAATGDPILALGAVGLGSAAKQGAKQLARRDAENALRLVRSGQGGQQAVQQALSDRQARQRLISALLARQSIGSPATGGISP